MRRLLVLVIALSSLACHREEPTHSPAEDSAEDDQWRLPSLVDVDNAVRQRDWDRALDHVELLLFMSDDEPGEHARLQRLQVRLMHARWVDRGDPDDFAWLERAATNAIDRDFKRLEPRAALIRLYAEQAAITGTRAPLLLAQLTEREARQVADEHGLQSPALELVSGFVRELEGDRQAAVAAWTRALELNMALVEPHLWLGLAAVDRHDYAGAQVHLQAFVDVHPSHVDALLALSAAARGAGEHETAERVHAQIIAVDPEDPRVYWNRAMARDPGQHETGELSEYGDALREFDEAYRKHPPRSCPNRGAAGPDPACVREAEALVQAHAEVAVRLEGIDAILEIQSWSPR
jgi:tetratricopeptide (TPR) repeat protein